MTSDSTVHARACHDVARDQLHALQLYLQDLDEQRPEIRDIRIRIGSALAAVTSARMALDAVDATSH